MKLKNIFFVAVLALSLCSCSKTYMDTVPEDAVSKGVILESATNAKLAVNGLMRAMYRQYLSTQGCNGEGTMKYWFSDWQADDVHTVSYTGWANLWNSIYIENSASMYNYYMWYYYYKLIVNANAIIVNIDAATGDENEKKFIKAQALTMRAYSYLRLTEYYCPRYSEMQSHPQGIVLRLDESTGDLAPSDQSKVYDQIFKDLDDAITLFKASNLTAKDMYCSESYVPSIKLAYGVYARAALFTEKWDKAADNAKLAREGYSLMSVDDYINGGFSTPNAEWIFYNDGAATQSLHYYGFFSYNGSNASSSASRTYPKAISKTLYDQIPVTDIRRGMFQHPDSITGMTDYTVTYKSGSPQQKEVIKKHPGKIYSTSTVAAYMQFKFQGQNGAYNIGDICNMRASEMYLIEAEAQARLGKDSEAQRLLKELVKDSGRDPEFSTSLTGAALLEQVKLYRRIELWNEGFRWYDLKRYNEPRIRKSQKEGGNFGASFCVNLQPTDKNHWVYVIPNREKDYNKAFSANADPVKTEQ